MTDGIRDAVEQLMQEQLAIVEDRTEQQLRDDHDTACSNCAHHFPDDPICEKCEQPDGPGTTRSCWTYKSQSSLPPIYAHLSTDRRLLDARLEPPVSRDGLGGSRVHRYVPEHDVPQPLVQELLDQARLNQHGVMARVHGIPAYYRGEGYGVLFQPMVVAQLFDLYQRSCRQQRLYLAALVGSYSPDLKTANVSEVVCIRQGDRNSVVRDPKALKEILDERWVDSSGRRYFLGEWHSHPGGPCAPHPIDIETAFDTAMDPKANCPEFAMAISGGEGLKVWIASRKLARELEAQKIPISQTALYCLERQS